MVTIDRTHTSDNAELRPLSELSEPDIWVMVDASPDGMLFTDEGGIILFVNSTLEAMFGYDRGELLGETVEILVPERWQQIHAAHRTRYRAQPTSRAMGSGLSLYARHQDDTEFPVEISLSPVTTTDGLRIVATIRDISERMAVETHTHAVLHTIDEARDGVFMFTPDTLQFSYVNRGAVNQLGYSVDELLAMTPLHIKPEFTDESFRRLLAPLLTDEVESHTFTTIHRRKDGVDVPVEIILEYPPAAGPDKPRLLVALVRNISERLENERSAQAQREKLQILEDRERLARDLHDVVIQRLFAAGMALQSVQHLATDSMLAERVTETVEQLDQTIADLRSAIFKLTTKPTTITSELQEVIDQSAAALDHQPTLTIVGDVESIAPTIIDELLPTLTEALSNVARHARATSTDVDIDVTEGSISLTVTDDGIGIDPAVLRGNGITNIEARARRLGGIAAVTRNPDGGTTMSWTTPVDD